MKRLVFLYFVLCTVSSCAWSSAGLDPDLPEDVNAGIGHEMIVLGDKLDDPYSVNNITKAIASLYPTKADIVALDPTDLYVRFLPLDDADFDLLEEMGLDLHDHPFDYEILQDGDYYHDPSVPQGQITWQYAVVPIGFEAPEGIRFEVLDKVYLADHTTTKASWIDWEAVELEAFRLTGNSDKLTSATKGGSSSVPQGRITIIDKDKSKTPIGVAGVKVSCNVFVKFDQAYTDDDGYYQMSKTFSSELRYKLIFSNRAGFKIGFNLLLINGSVSTLGKSGPEGVSVTIDETSESKLFARSVANNSILDYIKSCESVGGSISVPPVNLKVWMFKNLDTSSAVMIHQGTGIEQSMFEDVLGEYGILVRLFAPDITIGLNGKKSYADIYRSVVHELAHSSHFQQVGVPYWNRYAEFILRSFASSGGVTYGVGKEKYAGYCEVGEMWAYFIENVMYTDRYPSNSKVYGTSYWFKPQVFIYLEERGLSRYKIFSVLGPDVTSREELQKRMISYYPEFKSTINQAFLRYK